MNRALGWCGLTLAVSSLVLVFLQDTEAQTIPASSLVFPDTDGGVIYAPPGACKVTDGGTSYIGCAAVQVICTEATNNPVRSIVVQNPKASSLDVRCGPAGVKGWPVATQNGIELAPGQSVDWFVSSGGLYCVSEGVTDAGVALGVVCSRGPTK